MDSSAPLKQKGPLYFCPAMDQTELPARHAAPSKNGPIGWLDYHWSELKTIENDWKSLD